MLSRHIYFRRTMEIDMAPANEPVPAIEQAPVVGMTPAVAPLQEVVPAPPVVPPPGVDSAPADVLSVANESRFSMGATHYVWVGLVGPMSGIVEGRISLGSLGPSKA